MRNSWIHPHVSNMINLVLECPVILVQISKAVSGLEIVANIVVVDPLDLDFWEKLPTSLGGVKLLEDRQIF